MKKKILITILTVAAVGLALTGCTANATTGSSSSDVWQTLQNSKTDPNHLKGITSSTISMLTTPTVTTAPLFDTKTKLPTGWKSDPNLADNFQGQNATVPQYYRVYAAYNSDHTCSLLGNVNYLSTTNSGKGDLFLSKNYLYQSLQSYQNPKLNEQAVFIKDGKKTLQFVTGYYDAQIPNFVTETNGSSSQKGTIEAKGYFIDRALDAKITNPTYTVGPTPTPGSFTQVDPSHGLPVISYTYTCTKPSLVSSKDFNNLMNSIAVQVK